MDANEVDLRRGAWLGRCLQDSNTDEYGSDHIPVKLHNTFSKRQVAKGPPRRGCARTAQGRCNTYCQHRYSIPGCCENTKPSTGSSRVARTWESPHDRTRGCNTSWPYYRASSIGLWPSSRAYRLLFRLSRFVWHEMGALTRIRSSPSWHGRHWPTRVSYLENCILKP
jgi:hypothetical protein